MTDDAGSGTLVGRQIADYQVLALLGAGGMGEVYRARDTRLGRDVALKVLQRHRAADPAHQARFKREAQAASALSHPNILAVYDVGVEDGIPFIVTELIDGTSLREVVERGPLPIKKLLDLATQVADGLAAAHEAGIVHRDLKPENLMVTRDGRAKILDFGLALAPVLKAPTGDATMHVTQTETGLIQGTVPYMSPEQARGESGDFRSDQFSFGLMLYEMTTGTRAFQRETPVQTLSAIITDEAPKVTGLNSRAPAQLQWLIERCLAKDPLQRYAATRDLAQDLKAFRDRLAETTVAASPNVGRRRLSAAGILFIVAATIAMALLGIDVWIRFRPTDLPLGRFEIPPPKGANFAQGSSFMVVSPDGKSFAFVASSLGGKNTLWLRRRDSPTPIQLPGTDGASQPFWSPDSRFVAFGVGEGGERRTKIVDVLNGRVETLDQLVGSGTWNADDVIVGPQNGNAGVGNDGLYRISAKSGGGPAVAVTTLDPSRSETAHVWPDFLPDGRHFLFIAESRQPENDGILYVGSLDSTQRTKVFDAPVDSKVVYAAPGYLLYMHTNTLWAVRFDADGLRRTGPPVLIEEHVECTFGVHSGAFSVSQAGGVLAYRLIGETQLKWFDRSGPIETIASGFLYGNPALSPNEQTVAVDRLDPLTGRFDIWLIDLVRGGESRVTSDPADELKPLWYPDGERLVYRSNAKLPLPQRPGPSFHSKPLSVTAPSDLVLDGVGAFSSPLGFAGDGSLLYEAPKKNHDVDLWSLSLPLNGDRKSVPVLHTTSGERQGQLSPDGQWIAYVSNTTERWQVYVASYPSGSGSTPVSINGGIEPKWMSNGKELFFLALDGSLMSVTVTTKANHTVELGMPKRLLETRMSTAAENGAFTRNQYVVTKDGRFLINQPETPTPITVVVNWTALLKR